MAVITDTIGTTARDFSTMTSWEASLSAHTGDDVTGECYNDSAFDEVVTMNDGTPTSAHLTAATGEGHDGTEGTGVRNLRTGNGALDIQTPSGLDNNYKVSWIEIDINGNEGPAVLGNSQNFTDVGVIANCLIHGQSGGNSYNGFVQSNSRDMLIFDSIFYDNVRNTSLDVLGLSLDADRTSGGCFNNTVFGLDNTGTGGAVGIKTWTNSANHSNKNNISIGHTAGGTVTDFVYAGTSNDADYNLSGDASADDAGGTNCQLSKTASSQFVSTTGGSEDLHLKSGADAIDTGVDLVTTPTGVNIDIDGRDRDSEGDTWDIGAHEFVAVGGGATGKSSPLYGPLGGPLFGPIG